MGITAHFIDNNWSLQSITLQFNHIPEGHSGQELCSAFCEVLEEFQIERKVIKIIRYLIFIVKYFHFSINIWKIMGLTMDNASANGTFFESLKRRLSRKGIEMPLSEFVRCFGHVLNLACEDFLKEIEDITNKARNMSCWINRTPQRKEDFKRVVDARCELDTPLVAVSDNNTRWNSTFYMGERSIALRSVKLLFIKKTCFKFLILSIMLGI